MKNKKMTDSNMRQYSGLSALVLASAGAGLSQAAQQSPN
jgi:hypothetical protein